MTPKEKAYELISKFLISRDPDGNNDVRDVWAARRCALISLDNVIDALNKIYDETGNSWIKYEISDWKEIKQELESEI